MQHRLSVVIISASAKSKKPTETAAPALAHVLRALKAEDALRGCEPCYGICSGWGREAPALQPSIIDPFGHAWFIHRSRFDDYLQQATYERGATWLQETARSVDFDGDEVCVNTSAAPVRARWLVAATGSPAWLARITGQKQLSLDRLVVFWGYLPITLKARLLFVEPTDFGWWYFCPADGQQTIACFVTDPQSARAIRMAEEHIWNELLLQTMAIRQLGCQSLSGFVHAAPVGLSALPRKHGHRWIAVGDAAAKLDPIGSSGTITALDSGQRAAHAVADALQGNFGRVESYERWNSALVREFTRQRDQHYAIEGLRRIGFWSARLCGAPMRSGRPSN